MKLNKLLVLSALVFVGISSEAQSVRGRTGFGSNNTPCTCTQTRTVTGQSDGTSSVCKFSAFGSGQGANWFDGGWYLTGDLVRFECSGGIAGTGRVTYGSSPSPLCSVTSRQQELPQPGRCMHQADTNHDGARSTEENTAWDALHQPVTSGSYAGKASQAAINAWNNTFGFLFSGSDLCDESRTPQEVAQCRAKPVECRRLDMVNSLDPLHAQQILDAFSGYSNNLNHCAD